MFYAPRLKTATARRRIAVSLSAALLLAAPLAVRAQAPAAASAADPRVTLDLREIPLRDAIALLFKNTGFQYAVDPNVPNIPITLNIRDIALPSALRLIVRQAATQAQGLTTAKEGDVYLIRIRTAPAAAPPAEVDAPPDVAAGDQELTWEKVTIQFNNVAVFALAFGGTMLPTEQDVLLSSSNSQGNGRSGLGGNNGFGSGNGFGGNGLGSSGFGSSGFGGGLGSTGFGSGLSGTGTLGGISGGAGFSGARF
jgi:hypothetical protein